MSVDLIALYLKLYAQCELAPDGVYSFDIARFHQDTGYTTVNVLTPLLKNSTMSIKAIGKPCPDDRYEIRMLQDKPQPIIERRE